MENKERHIANRILLGFAICIASIFAIFFLGVVLASNAPDGLTFVPLRIAIAVVGVAVFVGDRIYVSRQK